MNTRIYGECWGVGSSAFQKPEKKVKKSKKVSETKIEWFEKPVPIKLIKVVSE